MNRTSISLFELLFNSYGTTLSFEELKSMIRLYIWLYSVTFITGYPFSMCFLPILFEYSVSLDDYVTDLVTRLFMDCELDCTKDSISEINCVKWLLFQETLYQPCNPPPFDYSFEVQLSTFLPTLLYSVDHSGSSLYNVSISFSFE